MTNEVITMNYNLESLCTIWSDLDFVTKDVTSRQLSQILSGSSNPSCGRGTYKKDYLLNTVAIYGLLIIIIKRSY